MSDLANFESSLRSLIGEPTKLRPFVCDGSPLTCTVFLVGFNPATAMSVGFWHFWNSTTGFDKASWFSQYVAERQLRPLKPGKTRRSRVSNTRRVIGWVTDAAAPVRCLETNIYAAATPAAAELAARQRVTAPFDFLLSTLKPKLIVAHGVDAQEHLRRAQVACKVISVPHFARGWSRQRATALGQQIRSTCEA